jgi:hypothetical protein
MRLFVTAIISIFSFVSLFAVSLGLQNFTANAEGANISIRFVSQNETGISSFQLERAKENSQNFVLIKELTPKGNFQSYLYLDEGPFLKKSKFEESKNSEDIYVYRVKAVYQDGSIALSDNANITHKTSSVNKTWGMIKEMFR